MSYARSPRPVCSMTMGMRLACMPSAGPSGPAWIVPGLLFTGNAFCRRRWHDLCAGNHPGEGTIANQLRAQRGTELGTVAGELTPVTAMSLAGHHGLELRRDVGFGHGDAVARGERIQQQLRPPLDERGRHVEAVAGDQLLDHRLSHRLVRPRGGLSLEIA